MSTGPNFYTNDQAQTLVAYIREEQTGTTDGGTATSGSYATRVLNATSDPSSIIVSLSSNAFTLSPGTYDIEWAAPAFRVDNHQSRLFNQTGSTVVQYGTSAFAGRAGTAEVLTTSKGMATVTITSSTAYRIEHRVGTTQATNGFGTQTNFGNINIYTEVKVTKRS